MRGVWVFGGQEGQESWQVLGGLQLGRRGTSARHVLGLSGVHLAICTLPFQLWASEQRRRQSCQGSVGAAGGCQTGSTLTCSHLRAGAEELLADLHEPLGWKDVGQIEG